ncbi:MAG: metallophosphoesterase [Leptolyngbyaceae cyanobacterium SL_1_1]|nr:metallophosphoesterase [Leptolyngbyaceae cyanobacterium RM1_1_2]NJO10112.1 metallophosphoesterase [Leptolyngbyaceae cyanobacterium SL_1_1]
MNNREDTTLIVAGILLVLATSLFIILDSGLSNLLQRQNIISGEFSLLSDPFLQYPTDSSMRVVWFTEFEGMNHVVAYGDPAQSTPAEALADLQTDDLVNTVAATTTQLDRLREDAGSHLATETAELSQPIARPVWRHEAEVPGLRSGSRVPYQVLSAEAGGKLHKSRIFSLAPAPLAGDPLKILLTSDHQLMPMTPANLQMVEQTVGQVDAVFHAGDLVNIPDRASEWFDDVRGNAFFPSLQGRANYALERDGKTTVYQGGEIIQHAPLFPTLGNHEVMGRYSSFESLDSQFNDPIPWSAANQLYDQQAQVFNPGGDPQVKARWLKNNSFNTDTYEGLFTLPKSPIPGEAEETSRYYATTFGDIRLISLFVTNIWRSPSLSPQTRGRYRESASDLSMPNKWGYGQHVFMGIDQGSPQYQWLAQELASEAFQQAKYKIVMLHHPPHSLGDNIVPAFTNPVPVYEAAPDGSLKAIRYEYPKDQDMLNRDLLPLLEQAGAQLVFYGHDHIWNRFVSSSGMNFLESSNVGNTYNAHWGDRARAVPQQQEADLAGFEADNYVPVGDPYGLEPVVPAIAPLTDEAGTPLPYLASNDITAFSIFETATGIVTSYYFDTREPDSEVVKFDQFSLLP